MPQSTFIYAGPRAEPVRSEPADNGCWIDMSQFSADDLNRRIIDEMLDIQKCKFFVDTDMETWVRIANKSDNSDLTTDEREWLSSVADSAVEWLNEHAAGPGQVFVIEDNSLYLEYSVDGDD